MVYKLANEYHTQRNNEIDPANACNTTAMIMALKATGIPFSYPKDVQPEDHLAAFLSTPEAYARRDAEYPWAKASKTPPREVHALLSWAVNECLTALPRTIFTPSVSLQELLFRIARHRAASVVSGRFTPGGHVVTLVGFEAPGPDLSRSRSPAAIDLSTVSRVIIDDPWGDVRTGYRDHNGDDISLSLAEFDSLTREYGNPNRKWAHLFSRDGNF